MLTTYFCATISPFLRSKELLLISWCWPICNFTPPPPKNFSTPTTLDPVCFEQKSLPVEAPRIVDGRKVVAGCQGFLGDWLSFGNRACQARQHSICRCAKTFLDEGWGSSSNLSCLTQTLALLESLKRFQTNHPMWSEKSGVSFSITLATVFLMQLRLMMENM